MTLLALLVSMMLSTTPLVDEPSVAAQDPVDGFIARSFAGSRGRTMPYRLFVPEARSSTPLPLIVYLHGSGGAGTDNLRQISGGNTNGTHVWTSPEAQRQHPAVVLAPQLPENEQWGTPETDALAPYADVLLELIDRVSTELKVDPDRIYLTGQSRGGRGVWDIISKRPGLFAAAVPLCGNGDPQRVITARQLPLWAFHGAKDETIPVASSRELVAALRAAGSPVKYTEYPEVGHNVWTRAYLEPDLASWLFAQRRVRR